MRGGGAIGCSELLDHFIARVERLDDKRPMPSWCGTSMAPGTMCTRSQQRRRVSMTRRAKTSRHAGLAELQSDLRHLRQSVEFAAHPGWFNLIPAAGVIAGECRIGGTVGDGAIAADAFASPLRVNNHR